MRVSFHPLPAFTIATLVMLAVLVGLGTWQLQRLQWKLGLIAEVNRNITLPPLSLDTALKLGRDAEYRRVALTGRFDHAKEAFVYGIVDGAPVYHVVVPLTLADGRTLLVDRGIVPENRRAPDSRRAGQMDGIAHVIGLWRTPSLPGFFTPKPDVAHRIWFSRAVDDIARRDHIRLAAPVLVEADATPNRGRWPEGGHWVVSFRNDHLQYAVTWFGLALGLIGIYLAFHVQKGRLTFLPPRAH